MRKPYLPTVMAILGTTLAFTLLLLIPGLNKRAYSVASHVVISEIQIAESGNADDEFVELYNPTSSAVLMTDWKLRKKTAGGSEYELADHLNGTIPAYGYYLIAHPEYDGTTTPDATYSATGTNNILSGNNSVILYDESGINPMDLVGMGEVKASESAATGAPGNGKSIERKANSESDTVTMAPGGSDETAGNGQDSDNNQADFVTRSEPQPQNTSSGIEFPQSPTSTPTPSPQPTAIPTVSPTPSPEPTAIPTEIPTPTPSPEPTATPTDIPSPTPSPQPTAIPTEIPTPTPSPEPTSVPTNSPTPSPEPTATLTPSPLPSPIPSPIPTVTSTPIPSPTLTPIPTPQLIGRAFFPNRTVTCFMFFRPVRFFGRMIFYPVPRCVFE